MLDSPYGSLSGNVIMSQLSGLCGIFIEHKKKKSYLQSRRGWIGRLTFIFHSQKSKREPVQKAFPSCSVSLLLRLLPKKRRAGMCEEENCS